MIRNKPRIIGNLKPNPALMKDVNTAPASGVSVDSLVPIVCAFGVCVDLLSDLEWKRGVQ